MTRRQLGAVKMLDKVHVRELELKCRQCFAEGVQGGLVAHRDPQPVGPQTWEGVPAPDGEPGAAQPLPEEVALDGVEEVRGRGLMLGVGLAEGIDGPAIGADLLRRGLIVNVPEQRTIRLLPPLVVDAEQIERAVALIGESLDDAH